MPGRLSFWTTPNGDDSPDERMTIKNDGKVGIGTNTPAVILDVEDTTASSSTQGGSLRLGSNDGAVMASGHRLGVIEFAGAEDTSSTMTVGARIEAVTDATWSASENGAYLSFYTTDGNASQTEQVRIDASGNLGVGVGGTPSYRFHAEESVGSSFVGMFKNSSTTETADCLRLIISNEDGAAAAGNKWITAEDAGGAEWHVIGDGSGNVAEAEISDRRVKENIVDISDALSILSGLKPRRYNRKAVSDDKYTYGFIADEYATVFPNSVMGEANATKTHEDTGQTVPDLQSIVHKNLYALLTKAVQELSAKVTALESK